MGKKKYRSTKKKLEDPNIDKIQYLVSLYFRVKWDVSVKFSEIAVQIFIYQICYLLGFCKFILSVNV